MMIVAWFFCPSITRAPGAADLKAAESRRDDNQVGGQSQPQVAPLQRQPAEISETVLFRYQMIRNQEAGSSPQFRLPDP
jgi:hypothetical protein